MNTFYIMSQDNTSTILEYLKHKRIKKVAMKRKQEVRSGNVLIMSQWFIEARERPMKGCWSSFCRWTHILFVFPLQFSHPIWISPSTWQRQLDNVSHIQDRLENGCLQVGELVVPSRGSPVHMSKRLCCRDWTPHFSGYIYRLLTVNWLTVETTYSKECSCLKSVIF